MSDQSRSTADRSADALTQIAESLEKLTDRRPPRIGHSNLDLRQFRFSDFAASIRSDEPKKHLIEAFDREVPSEYWSLDTVDSFPRALPVAVISCPCGETPEAVAGVAQTCDCGRAFLFSGQAVKVAFSPASNTQTPAAA